MGQCLRCLSCTSRKTKVLPFGPVPRGMKYSKTTLSVLRQPVHSSLERRLSGEVLSRSSLATISLGSLHTLPSPKIESSNMEAMMDENKDGSSSAKEHPGMFYNTLKGKKNSFVFPPILKLTPPVRGSNGNTLSHASVVFYFARSFRTFKRNMFLF